MHSRTEQGLRRWRLRFSKKVLFHAGLRKTVDMFPLTNRLRRTRQKSDLFRCIRLDMFPRTNGTADIKMDVSSHVETVCLLESAKNLPHISFTVNMEDLPRPTRKSATYDEIKAYVSEKHGLKVSSLYIAQIKEKHGLKERENYNIGNGKSKELVCPPEKEQAILDAFKHFGMIK